MKTFIYLAIIVIIAILNNAGMTHAKTLSESNILMLESLNSRVRRDVSARAFDEGDMPKEHFNSGSRLRTRRQAPPGESEIPKGFQKDTEMLRQKRQMPSPPGEMPMPPM